MPVGFNSPARNFFLLGSSGDGVVGNFFDTIDRSAGTDGVYLPDEIRYNYTDQKYLLAGSASDNASKSFGWFEKRDETGALEFDVRVEAGAGVNTTLRAMELDSNNNLIVAGFAGTIIPLTLDKLKIDPALASGVILTTITDVFGFLSFLGLATLFLI